MARVFVTGGSGFVGRNLIPALVAAGHNVRALARSEAATATVARLGAEPVRGDLVDAAALAAGMAGCQWVFHVAARTNDWGRYEDAYQANVAGTEQALASARGAGVARFIHVSTESVLVGTDTPPLVNVDETRPRAAHPLGLYALTKGLAEERVLAANTPDMATVIVRPRLIWGAGDTTVLPPLLAAVRSGAFVWFGGGGVLTSTCHVANVCEGLLLAAERGRGGEIYFVTDGEPIAFRTFLTALLGTQGVTPGSRSIPLWLARAAAGAGEGTWRLLRLRRELPLTRFRVRIIGEEVTVSDAKARRELGYVGRVTRAEGLAAMTRAAAAG
ncbi:MAG TPA: NAD-dependent epimerase/dehydratase family protein [Ktedonobacterales bacterium]|nr:NAD-dependent epimerase/dehydratase family protein [Ktedonobacterales bacterium]